ncbi:peroxisome membrane protein [Mycotypha africana]|uniref:peroxisome membrane protein n=1 Tax=Mycotypha africana TaxID=64632 RepID=UPI0023004E5E|nr:peroxisome membrane protein [Mycotypha africana]KAI8991183.1 peroxisome membrane protein [Mycotypha africana]
MCSQSVLTVLNLVSCFHTHCLINKSMTYHRHTNDTFNSHFHRQHKMGKVISTTLSVISYTEVLMEMILLRKMRSKTYKRWQWITIMEGIKAVLRIVLLLCTKKRMLLYPMHYIRNVDTNSLEMDMDEKYELLTFDPRNGTALSHFSDPTSKEQRDALTNNSHGSNVGSIMSELLWILRPLIYVAMTMYEQQRRHRPREKHSDISRHEAPRRNDNNHGHQEGPTSNADVEQEDGVEKEEEALSWKPWLVSLCIDILSKMTRHATTPLERDESKRRDYLFLYYLLRGPAYTKLTKFLLDRFCNATEHRPLISVITAAINDYRPFWEDTYFYTAGS